MICKCSINPITNSNPVYSHSITIHYYKEIDGIKIIILFQYNNIVGLLQIIWPRWRKTSSSCQLFWLVIRPTVLFICPYTNKPQTNPTEITEDCINGPCYACSPCFLLKCAHSCIDVPFQEQSKPGTWEGKFKPWLLCKVSTGFSRDKFIPSTNLIQLLFSEHHSLWFSLNK
jgi:hypothetical protein